jgi:hypothetical protein
VDAEDGVVDEVTLFHYQAAAVAAAFVAVEEET